MSTVFMVLPQSRSLPSMAPVTCRLHYGGGGPDFLQSRSPYFICDRPAMNDPLSEVIALLQPRAVFSRRISGAGRWGVRYSAFGQPSFCAVLEGRCRLDRRWPPSL